MDPVWEKAAKEWLKKRCPNINTDSLNETQLFELYYSVQFCEELGRSSRHLEITRMGDPGDAADVYSKDQSGRIVHLQLTEMEEKPGDIRDTRDRLGPQDSATWQEVEIGGQTTKMGPARSSNDFNAGLKKALQRKSLNQCPSPSALVVCQTSQVPWDWDLFPPDLKPADIPPGFDEVWILGTNRTDGKSRLVRLK